MKTYVYKVVGEARIQADVYGGDGPRLRPSDHAQGGPKRGEGRPVVVWIHGGALINGTRRGVPQLLLDLCGIEGYALVSIDYRLAPEVKLPAIIEDVRDALAWIRQEGQRLFQAAPERLVVAGGSAGGYLTMMTGICVRPRPKALVAYWGYGDVDGVWYTKPSEYYCKEVPPVSKEEAYQGVGGSVLTETTGDSSRQKARGRYYLYLRQNGLWAREVAGFDPETERGKFDPYCPVRNITADYPPILMIHGTEDTDVPYEESAAMARELARHNVPHELITVSGAGHGLAGGDPKLVADAHARAAAFIRGQLS